MKLAEYREQLQHDPDYLAAEEELRPLLALADMVLAQRLARGWSQADLAERVGTKQANISRLESGLANPSVKFLQKLANALGATLTIQVEPDMTLDPGETSQCADRVVSHPYPPTRQRTMPAGHDSLIEWQTDQTRQRKADPRIGQDELNDMGGQRPAFPLIKGSGDAVALTDEQVAAAIVELDEEDSQRHASFVRY